MGRDPRYLIITPCHNEERYIEYPLRSVLGQTAQPLKWIIVDDGSTDGTAGIIKAYAGKSGLIEYRYRKKPEGQAYFASNVFAIMEGYDSAKGLDFDYLAILDADIELPPEYYERLIGEMERDDRLGICSGVYVDCYGEKRVDVPLAVQSTPKAIQFFRRECFEEIGGYIPFRYGGEDSGTEIMARMKGWRTVNFPDLRVLHRRPMGLGSSGSLLRARFRRGYAERSLGTHPFFLLMKYLRRMFIEKPFFFGAVATLLGFARSAVRGDERQLPEEAIAYIRDEQMRRLMKWKKK